MRHLLLDIYLRYETSSYIMLYTLRKTVSPINHHTEQHKTNINCHFMLVKPIVDNSH